MNSFKCSWSIGAMVSLMLPGLSLAADHSAPVSYPVFPEALAKVQQVEGLGVIGDLKSDKQFYVLPPSNGTVTSNGLSSASANMDYCETIAQLHDQSLEIIKKYQEELNKYDASQLEAEQMEKDYNEGKKQASALKVSIDGHAKIMLAYDQQITSDQARLDDLYVQENSCQTRVACAQIKKEIAKIRADVVAVKKEKADSAAQNDWDETQYERAQSHVQDLYDQWQSKLNYLTSAGDRIKVLSKQNIEIYGEFAKLEGGTATLKYDSHWTEQFKQLVALNRSTNPGFSFTKIDTEDAIIHAAFKSNDSSSYLSSVPAILDYRISGQRGEGDIRLNAFPEKFSADLRLSLAGACAIANPARYRLKMDSQGVPEYGVSVDYKYRSAYHSHAKFFVDEKTFYQKVMNAGNSGFLWWKKSWENLDITQIDSSAYHFEWELLDPHTQYKPEERRKMEAEAVNFIISRLVSKYGTVNTTDPNAIARPPVPSSGLGDMANGLFTLCGTSNMYCAAASWIMKGLDEIIAGGSSSASGTRTFESKGELTWDETILQAVPATSSFESQYTGSGIKIIPVPSPSPSPTQGANHEASN